MTFAEFVTAVYRDILNKHGNTLTVLREQTVKQLQELQLVRTLFMEATGTFNTVALQEGYTLGTGGVPADILTIDQLYWTTGGGRRREIRGPVAVDELRFVFGDTAATQYASAWGWQANQLVLGPKPSTIVALSLDYTKDATRDTVTGVLITTASTTQTNPWFARGELALRNAVMAAYYAMPAWRDQEAAGFATVEKNRALQVLRNEWYARKNRGGQAPVCWGAGDTEGSYDPWL